ncbi:MAG: hypothetical protein V4662_10120 [Verrucomicrobiota bacterium]
MRRFTFLCLMALGLSSSLNAEIPLDDNTIIVGERVGPIEKGMTLFGLKTMFGGGKVKAVKIPGAEGEEIDGVRLFGGTEREIEILFNPEGDEKEIWDVRIIGKGWKFANGLTKSMSIAELEKVNGKPYQVNGFGWDYGGWANFEGGKLEGKVSIRFSPEGDVDDSLNGDKQIPSTNKKLRAAKVSMTDISVSLR